MVWARMLSHSYRSDIDGLRAVAILLVLIFHAFPDALPGGFIGVDVFFVISGYLITGIIQSELQVGRFSLATFYARRIRRIFPALIVVLSATLMLGWFFFLPNEFISLGKNVYAGALFFPNLMLLSEVGYFDTAAQLKPLRHLWSLGIEEQFYFAFPLVLLVLWRVKRRTLFAVIAIALASFALNAALLEGHPSAAFYLPFTRAWELMAGAALVMAPRVRLWAHNPAALIGIGLIATAAFCLDRKTPYPGWWTLPPVVGTALLIISPSSLLNRSVLSVRPVVFMGLISYPLYLWHWPLLSFFDILLERPSPELRAAVILASAVLAYVTYRFIEKPIRSGPFRVMKVAGLSAAMLVVCAGGILVVISGGYPPRLSAAVASAGILSPSFGSLQKSRCMILSDVTTEFPAECIDTGTSGPLLLLWGDSTAGALAPGFRKLQATRDFRFGQLVISSCQPILDYDAAGVPNCRKMNDRALAIVQNSRPDIVVLASLWGNTFEEIGKTVARLKALNVPKVIVMGRPPVWNTDLATSFLKFHLIHGGQMPTRQDRSHVDSDWTDARIKQQVEAAAGEFVSTYAAICNADSCLTRAGDNSPHILASDRLHLTEAGSIFVVNEVAKEIFAGIQ